MRLEDPLHVLVVDDSKMMRERIVTLLNNNGTDCIIKTAVDVGTALVAMEASRPQVVILDISMPGTAKLHNGIDLLRWIRQKHVNTEVIMLTNLSEFAYRTICMGLGAYAFLDKSSDFDQLTQLIDTIAAGL